MRSGDTSTQHSRGGARAHALGSPKQVGRSGCQGKNLVGVDIGASSIKVVQLKEQRKRLTVFRYGYATLPPQTIVDGHVMNAGIITEALLKIFADQKINQKDVAIGDLRAVGHRPQDLGADDDRRRARRADQLGGRAAHPLRHQGHVDRLRGAATQARRRPDGSAPRRREEGRDQRLRADLREAKLRRSSSTSTPLPSRTSSSSSTGLPEDGTVALLNVGAAVSSLNIVSQGVPPSRARSRTPARPSRRRSGSSATSPTSRPRHTSAAGADPDHPAGGPPRSSRSVRYSRRRDPAVARLLPGDERRARDRSDLRFGRARRYLRAPRQVDREAGARTRQALPTRS